MAASAAAGRPIPGAENLNYEKETSIHRVTEYPVVKESLSSAYHYVHANSYTASAYDRIEQLSQSIIALLKPRLPLEVADVYANAGLDFVEKRFPAVKSTNTSEIVSKVRKPADDAAALAKSYADGLTSRFSPVTDQIYARIGEAQTTIHKLQGSLASAVGSLPRDKASLEKTMQSLFKEVESLTNYISNNAKEFPAHTREAVKPLVETLTTGLTHIREELSKPDTTISQKATNVLHYTQSQIGPVLSSLRETISKKKLEVEETAKDVKESS